MNPTAETLRPSAPPARDPRAELLPGLSEWRARGAAPVRVGRVTAVRGSVVVSSLPDAHLGEVCAISRRGESDLMAEVIGFEHDGAWLMPYGRLEAVSADAEVRAVEVAPTAPVGPAVRGRVLDALGRPLDDRGPLDVAETGPLYASPPRSMDRRRADRAVSTGIRVIDGCLTVAEGQRLGILAAAGVGKSTLLGAIVKNVDADTIVLALIGERGHEVPDFVMHKLDADARARATVIASTGDESALLRMRAAYFAMAVAEAARARGERVVLMMDSVTRFARALREVGHAVGEPLGRGGYPNTLFTRLPQLFERAGNDARGSITGFFTVLADSDDVDDPVVEETISLLDGHVVLSREIAKERRFPAVDVLRSVSRMMDLVTDDAHRDAVRRVSAFLAEYGRNYDKIKMGHYRGRLDAAGMEARHDQVAAFLSQDTRTGSRAAETRAGLLELVGSW